MRCAVVDIGTNSVKLLVAEVAGDSVTPVWEESHQTRLGQGFYKNHQLQPAALDDTARTVARFTGTAHQMGAQSIRLLGTSAIRDARNRQELVGAIWRLTGLPVEVISGEQEADLAFAGVQTDPAYRSCPLLILDVGGGSTEFILGKNGRHVFRRSFPIGTVRLLEEIQPGDPPTPEDWKKCRTSLEQQLHDQVRPLLQDPLGALGPQSVLLVGTGGTVTMLAAMELGLGRFDRDQIEQVRLARERIWEYQRRLWSMPLDERRKIPGLPANRADLIVFGVAIVALIMDTFGFEVLRASTRGLRFAAVQPGRTTA